MLLSITRCRSIDRRCRLTIAGGKLLPFLACLLVAGLSIGCWSAKEDAAKLEEVKAVWARLPIYPDMQQVSDLTRSGGGNVLVSKKFRSGARYDDVKHFYIERLGQDGWETISDRKLNGFGGDAERYYIQFQKRDIYLSIESAGAGSDSDWQYAIAVTWSRWVKK